MSVAGAGCAEATHANRRNTLTLPNGIVSTYGFDDASQLKTLTYKKGTTTVGDLAFTYDNAGRRTKVTGSLARVNLPAALGSATYNVNNQLTNWATPITLRNNRDQRA